MVARQDNELLSAAQQSRRQREKAIQEGTDDVTRALIAFNESWGSVHGPAETLGSRLLGNDARCRNAMKAALESASLAIPVEAWRAIERKEIIAALERFAQVSDGLIEPNDIEDVHWKNARMLQLRLIRADETAALPLPPGCV